MSCWTRFRQTGQQVNEARQRLIAVSSEEVERITRTLTASVLANLGDRSLTARLILSLDVERTQSHLSNEVESPDHAHHDGGHDDVLLALPVPGTPMTVTTPLDAFVQRGRP